MVNIHRIKQEICDIGSRIYKKGFAAANDGNISYRVSETEVVCTPTLVCKGFLKPDDLCIVDMEGNLAGYLSGTRRIDAREVRAAIDPLLRKTSPDGESPSPPGVVERGGAATIGFDLRADPAWAGRAAQIRSRHNAEKQWGH